MGKLCHVDVVSSIHILLKTLVVEMRRAIPL